MKTLILIFALLLSSVAQAAITEVPKQRAQVSSATSPQGLAYPNNVTAGNLLCVGGSGYYGDGITTFNVSDTLETSYSVYVTNSTGAVAGFIACGKALSSGANTVTVQPDALDTYTVFAIDEFTGQDSTTFLDEDGGPATGSSTTPTMGIDTNTANALVLAVMTDYNGNSTITEDGAWTLIGEEEDGSSYVAMSFIFKIVTSATTYSPSWTISSNDWAVYAIAIKAGAGGAGVMRVIVVE